MSELDELAGSLSTVRFRLQRVADRYLGNCSEIARTIEEGVTHLDLAMEQVRLAAQFADWEDRRREAEE